MHAAPDVRADPSEQTIGLLSETWAQLDAVLGDVLRAIGGEVA
ncbi:hypothetical protein [Streptomyces sp. NPDC049879]